MLSTKIQYPYRRIDTIRPYKTLVAASLILPLFLFSIVIWQDYRSTMHGLEQNVLSTTEILHQHAENVFETHQLIAERISERLRGLTWDEIGRSTAIQLYLKKLEVDYPQAQAIWLADPSGVVRNASQQLPPSPVSVADRDYFSTLRETDVGTFVGNIVKPREMKNLNFNIVRRRESETGTFNGVIIVTVFPEYFSDFWNKVTQKQGSAVALVRGDGMMLARAPRLDPNLLKLPPDARITQAIKGAEQGSFFAKSLHDGSERFYAFRKVGRYNAYMVYGIDVEAALQEWRNDLVIYGSLFGLATSALLLLALLALRRARNEQLAVQHWQDSAEQLEAKSTELQITIQRLQLATASAKLGVWDWDVPGNIMVWDDRMLELYGLSQDNFPGGVEAWENSLHPEDRAMAFAEVQAAFREDTQFDTEFRIVHPDGTMLHIKANGLVIRDPDGKAIRMIGINQDISERKRMEDEIQRSRDELEMRVSERTHELALTINTLLEEITSREIIEKELRHSEESHRLAVESTGLGTFDYYPLTGEVVVSDLTKQHLGLPADANIDHNVFLSCIHPGDRETTKQRVSNVLRPESGGEYRNEYRTIGVEDGKERWIASRGQVFFNGAGEAVRFIGITRDITKEKQYEATILRLNRLYAVLSSTNQAIARNNDRDSLFRELCRIAVEQGGFRLAWVGLVDKGSGLVNAVASHGETQYLDDIRISVREEPEGMGPTGIAIREGTYYICNNFRSAAITLPWHERAIAHGLYASASIALTQNNEVIGALTLYAGDKEFFDSQQVTLLQQMASDVSFALENNEKEILRRKAEQALLEETEERLKATLELRQKERLLIQQSRLAAMGEMIGNIAHQWRQPLNTLGLIVQSMQFFNDISPLSKEELNAHVKKAMVVIKHMSQTIDDFRDFFKPEKEMVSFHVKEVVTKAISLVESSFSSIGILIEVYAMGDPDVTGFPNEYSQVLLNVLVNARDALMEREIKDPRIVINIREQDGRSLVTISDNAGGIPEDIMEKIFDPYFTTKGPDKGTGLGLYMAKIIIEKNMNGKLKVCNTNLGAELRMEV